MKEIDLGRGYRAIVDDADFPELSRYRWGYKITNGKVYASHQSYSRGPDGVRVQRQLSMHRLLLGLSDGDRVQGDHRNGDSLDNRRANLRRATPSQNQHNRQLQKNNTTGYKGVCVQRPYGNYRVVVKYKGKKHHVGCFWDLEQAARAYDDKAKELFGEFARLNFPE